MLADGHLVGDGSWTLRVLVTDLNVEKTLRVKGDTHIGGVMLNLVEEIDIANDWSDHALWWPQKNMWLKRNRSTLDMYGVTADAVLEFTPMHKTLRVQLPDLRYIDCRVDFSVKVLNAVINLCKDLGIRYPEELSFQKPLEPDDIKYNYAQQAAKRKQAPRVQPDTNTFVATHNNSLNTTNGSSDRSFGNSTLNRSNGPIGTPIGSVNTWRPGDQSYNTIALNGSSYSPLHDSLNLQSDSTLASSPAPSPDARVRLLKPKSLVERARLNVSWLNSSLSIMEQGIRPFDCLLLRFKFYSFYDLNPKYDAVRINQLYEQAKWQLLNEEIDCTEEEMLMFAALQLQVNLQCNNPIPCEVLNPEDDIDAALTDLQTTLEGTSVTSPLNDITQIPEISDYLRFFKWNKFTLRRFKRYWFVCKDLQLYLYKSSDEVGGEHAHHINLRGCEVSPNVNISQGKYEIRIEVPSESGMSEVKIMCDNENKYAKWMAACRLAAKGKTLADSTYEGEVKSILSLLSMQQPAMAPAISPSDLNIDPDDYMANRFVKKFRGKLIQRILEAHANVKDLGLAEAKLSYIKAWQSLPDYGVSLFIVHFQTSKKEDLLGVAYNRLMRMDVSTGDHIKTWRFNTMKAWNINWEVKHMMVQFEEDKNIIFNCLSADCKVIHEFIGGYIYMSMRNKDASQTLNEELFHKLTGGWV